MQQTEDILSHFQLCALKHEVGIADHFSCRFTFSLLYLSQSSKLTVEMTGSLLK